MPLRWTICKESRQLVEVLADGSTGRTVIFRGLNVVFKEPPYHPHIDSFNVYTSFCEKDVAIFSRLGLNAIRLHVSWAAVEPVRGKYELQYLEKIRQIVRMCHAKGIHTLLEFHQDVLCRQCCGHGLPDWCFSKPWTWRWASFPWPLRLPFTKGLDHIPLDAATTGWTWYLGYLTYACCSAWQRFYDDKDGLLTSFAAFWKTVADAFADEDGVIGYELINEPWLGNIYKNPLLLLPGFAGKRNIHRLNEVVGKAIRSVDPYTPIFVSDPTLDRASGLPDIPFAHSAEDVSAGPAVLAYHFYQPPARCTARSFIDAKLASARRLGTGAFLTEFEMWPGPPEGREQQIAKIGRTLSAADDAVQSWLGWSYKTFAQPRNTTSWDGSLFDPSTEEIVPAMERLLCRPYARKVAGTPHRMTFDTNARRFELEFTPDLTCRLPTEVFVQQEIWFPDGFDVQISTRNEQHVSLRHTLGPLTEAGWRIVFIEPSQTHQGDSIDRYVVSITPT